MHFYFCKMFVSWKLQIYFVQISFHWMSTVYLFLWCISKIWSFSNRAIAKLELAMQTGIFILIRKPWISRDLLWKAKNCIYKYNQTPICLSSPQLFIMCFLLFSAVNTLSDSLQLHLTKKKCEVNLCNLLACNRFNLFVQLMASYTVYIGILHNIPCCPQNKTDSFLSHWLFWGKIYVQRKIVCLFTFLNQFKWPPISTSNSGQWAAH